MRVRGGGGVEIHGYVVGTEFFLALSTGTGRVWSFRFCTVVVVGMILVPVQTSRRHDGSVPRFTRVVILRLVGLGLRVGLRLLVRLLQLLS